MKKRLVASFAAAMVLGIAGTSFAAANPFIDVPAKHWSYDSVMKLSQAGIIDGADGKFQGEKVITRYEMAQIVARAMAKEEKANAAQKAELKKLATEFSEELNTMGVRLTALEKNQPNLKFNGTVDMRYNVKKYSDSNNVITDKSFSTVGGEYRLRLDGTAKVDDNNTIGMRLTSGVGTSGSVKTGKYISTFTGIGAQQADTAKGSVTIDRLFLASKIGGINTIIGEQAVKLGSTNFIVDSGAYSFDGVAVKGKLGEVNLTAQWGQQQEITTSTAGSPATLVLESTVDIASLEASAKIGKVSYGLGYATLKNKGTNYSTTQANGLPKDIAKYQYGNIAYSVSPSLTVGGEYVKNASDAYDTDNTAWNINATYGDQVLAAKGQQNIVVKYYKVGQNSISRLTSFDLQDKSSTSAEQGLLDVHNLKGLNVSYNYAFSKNLISYAAYTKVTDDNDLDRGYKFIRAGLTAKF